MLSVFSQGFRFYVGLDLVVRSSGISGGIRGDVVLRATFYLCTAIEKNLC
ncbi:MAG: hypothetical protein JZD40_06305 [Sulfolobus sp.]|nr:hypothetical protein [Sulfolobus sp.]